MRLNRWRTGLLLALFLCDIRVAAGQPRQNPIRAEAIRAHMRFLADDLLEGRGTGTRGFDIAAQYVASQFEMYGLRPGGTAGTYYQSVPIVRARAVNPRLTFRTAQGTAELQPGKDFIIRADARSPQVSVTAAVVFIGFGISAPEFNVDDYAGIDVRGRIVAFVQGGGESLPDIARAIHASAATKIQAAAGHGAIGVISITANRLPNAERLDWRDENGNGSSPPGALKALIIATEAAAAPLIASHGSFNEVKARLTGRTLRAFDTQVEVTASADSAFTPLSTSNVAGVLEGSHPTLKNEYVVFTAHLDHVGVGEPVNGDAIYNGAADNAAGVAVLLEVVRAMSSAARPPRSVLFLAVTGEESGLLGSDYFAQHPTVPIDSIIANVNCDGVDLSSDPVRDFVALGATESRGIADAAAGAARTLKITMAADPFPEEGYFVRSDQYSFVKRGIPAVFLIEGPSAEKASEDYIARLYHQPSDDMTQAWNFQAAATSAHLHLLVTDALARVKQRPTLNAGEFLARRYPRAAAGVPR